MLIDTDREYRQNLRLSQLEYEQGQVYLYSRPRCLGLVLGNACNIDCIHCYQSKNGANLLRPAEIGIQLRRELMAFYPYLSTLRIQGGEVLAMRGFRELVDDVTGLVDRKLISISTNGTLLDDAWAERLVRGPFVNITVSIDGGTRATYNRLRQGADLDQVLANINRVRNWKQQLHSDMPYLDSFFVIMRSNFREIPRYLQLMAEHGMGDVTLQTMELSTENTSRHPTLEADEAIRDRGEVEELYALMKETLPHHRQVFRTLRVTGLQSLFESHGLETAFLEEGRLGLYPDSDGLSEGAFELCPNPWTTLFIAENGDAHVCFIAKPIGNLYAASLSTLWNSPAAMAKRSDMIAGRYLVSGCSAQFCGWREGHAAARGEDPAIDVERRALIADTFEPAPVAVSPDVLQFVRQQVAEARRQKEQSDVLLTAGQSQIDHLEAKAQKAITDFRELQAEFARYRDFWPLRWVSRVRRLLRG
ncbi:radical SAM protein [Paludibaculum fermentans]|uniref:radical SAM protein n=1 Tax=Paludibaculum fermentans TaxID=1473598 RepID=UPI003EBAC26B